MRVGRRCLCGRERLRGRWFGFCNLLYWSHRALSWTGSHAERRQISILANENERLVFAGASDDLSMPATLVAILSLLSSTAASFLRGARAERAAFFSIGLVAAKSVPRPNHSLTKPSHGGDRQQDDVVVTLW